MSKYYNIIAMYGTEFTKMGPYTSDESRRDAASKVWNGDLKHDPSNNICKAEIDSNGELQVSSYITGELDACISCGALESEHTKCKHRFKRE